MVELYRFAIVGLVGAVIWAYALGWTVRCLFRRLLKRPAPPRRPAGIRSLLHRGVLLCALLGVAAVAWGFAEPYFPRVERIRIESDKVTGPVRIVQLSDLHCDPKVRAEEKLVRTISELKPDLIVFTGDGVNSDAGIPVFRRTMRALSKIAPLYGVRGNWEAWWFTHVNTFKGTGMIELNGPPRTVTVAGQQISLAGSAVDEEHRLRRALKQMPKKSFRLVLHHFPAAEKLVDGRADLLLTGDTHGGQIRLPLIGPLIRIRRWNAPFYATGLHTTRRGTPFYVHRGVGMEGHNVPRVRFLVPPEIALFEVVPKAGSRRR